MEVKVLKITEDILGSNKEWARKNRDRLEALGILTINVMSSPGAGKTSLIVETIRRLKGAVRVGVIEGDLASRVDADKVHREGAPVVQINTGGGCHLDAAMIEKALLNLPLEEVDALLIENVGNLVCPAEFDLGEHRKVMLLSVPEGDDKPQKYPVMFSGVDVVLVNKTDVLAYFDFDMTAFLRAVTGLNPDVKIFPISCKTGEGLETWVSWLQEQLKQRKVKNKDA